MRRGGGGRASAKLCVACVCCVCVVVFVCVCVLCCCCCCLRAICRPSAVCPCWLSVLFVCHTHTHLLGKELEAANRACAKALASWQAPCLLDHNGLAGLVVKVLCPAAGAPDLLGDGAQVGLVLVVEGGLGVLLRNRVAHLGVLGQVLKVKDPLPVLVHALDKLFVAEGKEGVWLRVWRWLLPKHGVPHLHRRDGHAGWVVLHHAVHPLEPVWVLKVARVVELGLHPSIAP